MLRLHRPKHPIYQCSGPANNLHEVAPMSMASSTRRSLHELPLIVKQSLQALLSNVNTNIIIAHRAVDVIRIPESLEVKMRVSAGDGVRGAVTRESNGGVDGGFEWALVVWIRIRAEHGDVLEYDLHGFLLVWEDVNTAHGYFEVSSERGDREVDSTGLSTATGHCVRERDEKVLRGVEHCHGIKVSLRSGIYRASIK